MKSLVNKIVLIIFVVMVCVACSEGKFSGQFPVDNTPPAPVTVNPDGVVNFQGGATITYQLPDETDLLYVKAVYRLPNGVMQEEKASVFSNSLKIKGFGRATTTKVQLISVDRSRNESRPVEVEIHPEDSPIYDIYKSLTVNESWGGMVLNWNNPLKESVVVSVVRLNDENVYEGVENFYSEAEAVNQSVRGLDSIRTNFGFFVRDTYNNYTDTLKLSLKPWFETQLDQRKFIPVPRSTKFTMSQYGNANMAILWDGIVTDVSTAGIYYFNAGAYPPYFAINLGVKAKLSRFRYWSRADYYFRLHSAKEIQIYGTNDPVVGNNPESDNSQWILLNPEVFVSVRPSGLDTSIPATGEDYAYALAGEEWEFPLKAPAVQWIRFQQLSTWTGTMAMTVCEVRFWGDPNFKE